MMRLSTFLMLAAMLGAGPALAQSSGDSSNRSGVPSTYSGKASPGGKTMGSDPAGKGSNSTSGSGGSASSGSGSGTTGGSASTGAGGASDGTAPGEPSSANAVNKGQPGTKGER